MITLKLNKGLAEKLLEWDTIKPDQSKNLTGEEITLELDENDVIIQEHKEGMKRFIEISDVNGCFGLWFKLDSDKLKKLREIVEEGP